MDTQISYRRKSHQDLQIAICCALIWIPLPLGSNRPWSTGLVIAIISAIGFVWAIRRWKQATKNSAALTKAKPAILALVTAQLLVAVQYFGGLSLAPSETFNHLLLGSAYTLLFVLVLDLFTTRKSINLLLGTVVISGTFQAFYGSTMALSGLEWSFFATKEYMQGLATGTFVNRNHLAGYLEITAACGIGLLLALRDHRTLSLKSIIDWISGPKALIRIALAIMVIGLVMTRSRMGNVAFVASMIFTGGILAIGIPKLRLKLLVILTSLLIIDFLIVTQYFGLDELQARLANTQFDDKIIAGEVLAKQNVIRDDVIGYASVLLKKHALSGSGAGSFEVIFPSVAGPNITRHFTHAHNDYMQFAIEYGVLGAAIFMCFFLFTFYHGIRALLLTNSSYRSGIGFACVMGMTAIAIHSFADFNLQIPANAATFTVLSTLGLLARFHTRQD
ncbi:O-antigen ligase family protein [Zhongshania arctica]|uniref:O-antigen ligase family protein n=1 Tax=Zhongshania arctica TaxID=3238302 RepID=A0ABV3TRJ8_9GAMM